MPFQAGGWAESVLGEPWTERSLRVGAVFHYVLFVFCMYVCDRMEGEDSWWESVLPYFVD